jgi:hypothetical protein
MVAANGSVVCGNYLRSIHAEKLGTNLLTEKVTILNMIFVINDNSSSLDGGD